MKKQRLLTLAIVICLLACLFTACDITFDLGTDITITFMVDGEVYHEMEVKNNSTVRLPAEPEKDGYVFAGWYLSEDYEEVFTSSYLRNNTVVADITVYAKWVEDDNPPPQGTFTIHFNSMGGSEVADIVLSEGTTFVLPDDPTKTGYTFAGWYLDESYQTIFESTSQLMDGIVLYAKWVEEHEHSYTTTTFAPDCENDGYTRHSCGCGYYYDDEIVPATGHTEGEVVVENKVDATCTTDGSYDNVVYCTVCEVELSRETKTIEAGHNHSAVVTPPTCTEQGYTTHTCACGDSYIDTYVDALGHDEIEHDAQEQTCTEVGWDAYVTCSRCDYSTYNEIPATGHSHSVSVTPPTCTEQGYTTHTCHCGDCYVDTYVKANGHLWSDWYETQAPTLIEAGEERRDCENCDYYETKELPAFGISGTWGNLTWTFNKNTGELVISGTGEMDDFASDSTSAWREYRDLIKSVTIGDSVTTIGSCAVSGCNNLTSITIPDSVTTIGVDAFYNCDSVTSMTIPDSVTTIGEWAFSSCDSLKDVYYTGDLAGWCGISFRSNGSNPMSCADNLYIDGKLLEEELVIPDSVTSIGSSSFPHCTSLTSIVIHKGVTNIGDCAFYECESLTSVTFEDDSQLTTIGEYAFYDCENLTSIDIPDSVTSIGKCVFYSCDRLTSVTFGENSQLTTIGSTETGYMINGAFAYCISLKSITIPDSVTTIGEYAFWDCSSLTSVTFGENSQLTTIGSSAFDGCSSLTSITIPSSVTAIGNNPFLGCSSLKIVYIKSPTIATKLTSSTACPYLIQNAEVILVEKSITSVAAYVTDYFPYIEELNCEGTDYISYSKHAHIWGDWYETKAPSNGEVGEERRDCDNCDCYGTKEIPALQGGTWGNLTWTLNKNTGELVISGTGEMDDFTTSSTSAWRNYSSLIKSVTIENGVTNIGDYAFYHCSSLTSITIPSSVTSIADTAGFANSVRLVEVINYSSLELTIGSQTHGSVAYYALEVHDGESKLTDVDGFVFYSCNDVNYLVDYRGTATDLVLPANFNGQNYKINKGVFYECTSLTSVKIPDSVTNIDICTFYGCTSLKSVTFGENSQLTSVGNSAFRGCTSLTSVKIPDSVTSIDIQAFYGCSSLSSIVIPDSVTSISKQAFGDCTSLTSITFEDPNGWYVKETAYTTSGTNLTLTNSSTNATYFTSTYADYYWHKL